MRSQTFPLLAIALLAATAVFGVDQFMLASAANRRSAHFERLLSDETRALNDRVNDARAQLRALIGLNRTGCDPAAQAARAETIAASPEMADIAVVDAGGRDQCSSLPVRFQSLDGAGVKPQTLDPDEMIATGLYGAQERPVLLLTHRSAAGGGALVAIMPYANLVTSRPGAGDTALVRLSYAATPVYFPGAILTDAAPVSIESANAAFEASSAATDRLLFELADTTFFPLTLAMSVDAAAVVRWFDPDRLIADIVAAALVFSTGFMVFVRKRAPRRLAAHIDRAIRRNEFEPLYRPIVDIASGRIAAVRMDVVWRAGKRDLSQDEFMADVISVRQDLKLWRSVLLRSRQTLAAAFKLRPRLLLKMVVDFETLLRPQFVDMVRRSMVGSGIRQSQIVICVPSVAEARDPSHAFDVLRALQSFGISIERLDSSDDIAFSFKTEHLNAGGVGLDTRLYSALAAEDDETAARARLWIEQIVEKARQVETRICAYDVPNGGVLRVLRGLGVREAEGESLVPPLTATTLMRLIARAGVEWGGDEEDAEREGVDEDAQITAVRLSA